MTKQNKTNDLMRDISGGHNLLLISIGIQLNLFYSLSKRPLTPKIFATANHINDAHAQTWLEGLTFSGYVSHNKDDNTYWLNAEQADLLVNKNAESNLVGLIKMWTGLSDRLLTTTNLMKNGGVLPGDVVCDTFLTGVSDFTHNLYKNKLIKKWIGSESQLINSLSDGCRVADVGSGKGFASINIAEAFGKCKITAIDADPRNCSYLKDEIELKNLNDRITVRMGDANDLLPENNFGLILLLDILTCATDPELLIKNTVNSLMPGGYCLCLLSKDNKSISKESLYDIGKILRGFNMFHEGMILGPQNKKEFGMLDWTPEKVSILFKKYGCSSVKQISADSDFYNLFIIKK